MKINAVRWFNFDVIREIVDINRMSDNLKKTLTSKASHVLKNVQVSLNVSEVSIFEIYFLNRFATEVIIHESPVVDLDSSIKKAVTPEKYEIVKRLVCMDQDINNDSDITQTVNINPIGLMIYNNIDITMTGTDILALFNGMVDTMISTIVDITDTEELSNHLISTFITEFYKFMSKNLAAVDVMSEFIIRNKYYTYINQRNTCMLSTVSCPGSVVSFFGADPVTAQKQLDKLKKYVSIYPNAQGNIKYTFVFNTTLEIMFLLDQLLKNHITDHQLFKELLGSPDDAKPVNLLLPEEVINKYTNRLSQTYLEYTTIKNIISQNPSEYLKLYGYLLANQTIKYMMIVTQSDLESIVSKSNATVKPIVDQMLSLISAIKQL